MRSMASVTIIASMPGPYILPHPRKLYALLCACPSSSTRAVAALQCLCGSTGAPAGYLLLSVDGQLAVVAGGEPPAGLLVEARRAWNAQPSSAPSDNTTGDMHAYMQNLGDTEEELEWTAGNGATYMARVLSVHREARFVRVAVAMLQLEAGRPLAVLRRVHVEALCNALLDSGDVQDHPLLSEPA
jgi:hypothetical protein